MAIQAADQYLPVSNRALKNHLGIVLHDFILPEEEYKIVLCLLYKGGYATWVENVDDLATSNGHYFNATSADLRAALVDYAERCNRGY